MSYLSWLTRKVVLIVGFSAFVAGLGALVYMNNNYVVPIVMYHQVTDGKGVSKAMTTSTKAFKKQMQFLYDHDYKVIPLEEYIAKKKLNKYIPRKTVVLTFDDGFVDNYANAMPILREFGFSATIFMPTGNIGRDGFLSLAQMKEMVFYEITFGSHTHSHSYLPEEPLDVQENQLKRSKAILEEKLERKVKFLSYPVGGFTKETKNLARQAGYLAAVTTNRGNDRFNNDVYELNRIRLDSDDVALLDLWVKFSGFYNLFRRLRPSF